MDKIFIVLQKNTFHICVKKVNQSRHLGMISNQYFHISSPTRLTPSGKNTVAEKLAVVYEEDMPVGQRWSSWHRAMMIIKRNDRFWWRVSTGDSEETRSDNDCEDLWGGLFWHSWCRKNQMKSFKVSLPSTNASALIVTTPPAGLPRPRGRFVRGGRSYSMCVDRGEVAHL